MILGASILQLPAIKQAKEMGLNVVVVDMNPDAIGFKEEGIEKEIISTIDIPKVVIAAKKHKIDGIMTLATDMPIETVSAVAKEMNLVGLDEQTALNATNKYEMRKALAKSCVPIPLFYKVSNVDELNAVLPNFKGKFIVKPADNSGSRGIFLVENKLKAVEAFEFSKANSRNGDVLVEEYMEGPEVSVETLTVGGVCHVIQITDKLTTGSPHFVEMGHSQPSQLSQNIQEKIKEVAVAANKAIGIDKGPSHTEIIVTSEGPKIVELGARLGGDCITTDLVPLSTGINMVELCIRLSLNMDVCINRGLEKGSAIRYYPQPQGLIVDVFGLNSALMSKGVKKVVFTADKGDMVFPIRNSSDRIGYVISQDENPKEAILDCEKAIEKISVICE